MDTESIQFRVFGPLRALRGGSAVTCGPTERAVLASLLLTPWDPVSVERVTTIAWPAERCPKDPTHAVQTHVMRLRHHLGPDVISTEGHMYRAVVEAAAVDAHRFTQLAHHAQELMVAGNIEQSECAYSLALDSWGVGTPWRDLAHSPIGAGESARLEELHLDARERRAELALTLDRLLVGEIERLVAEQPLRERRWALLMQTQVLHGRQADALRSYAKARDLLRTQLGIHPGPALQELEHRVLIQDPTLTHR